MSSSIPRRRILRLDGYDYSSEGLYFVTICTHRRSALFGEILDGKMILNEAGEVADEVWRSTFHFFDYSESWIVMPNHLHGVVAITDIVAGGSRTAPTRKPLGRLVGAFKTASTKRINEIRGTPGAVIWQRNFYEHVVRDDRGFERILAYIQENPRRWESDPENPLATKSS
jgi:REP element-mobilizing transposase RayT